MKYVINTIGFEKRVCCLYSCIILFMSEYGYKVREFVAQGKGVTCVCIGSMSNEVYATGGEDNDINVWTINSDKNVWTLTKNNAPTESLCFSPDEEYLAAGNRSGTVKVFDLTAGKLARTLNAHNINVSTLQYHPQGENILASGSVDCKMKMWDVRQKNCIQTYTGHSKEINCVRFSPDGKYVTSSAKDGLMLFWDVVAGKYENSIKLSNSCVSSFDYNPYHLSLAGITTSRTVKHWDAEKMDCLFQTPAESKPISALAFAQSGNVLCTTAKNVLKIWNVTPGKQSHLVQAIDMGWDKIYDMKVNSSGQVVATGFLSNFVSLFAVNISSFINAVEDGEDEVAKPLPSNISGKSVMSNVSGKSDRKDVDDSPATKHRRDDSDEKYGSGDKASGRRDGNSDRGQLPPRADAKDEELWTPDEVKGEPPRVEWEGGHNSDELRDSIRESIGESIRKKIEREAAHLPQLMSEQARIVPQGRVQSIQQQQQGGKPSIADDSGFDDDFEDPMGDDFTEEELTYMLPQPAFEAPAAQPKDSANPAAAQAKRAADRIAAPPNVQLQQPAQMPYSQKPAVPVFPKPKTSSGVSSPAIRRDRESRSSGNAENGQYGDEGGNGGLAVVGTRHNGAEDKASHHGANRPIFVTDKRSEYVRCEDSIAALLSDSGLASDLSSRLQALKLIRLSWAKGKVSDTLDQLTILSDDLTYHRTRNLFTLTDFFENADLKSTGLNLESAVKITRILNEMLTVNEGWASERVVCSIYLSLTQLIEAFGELVRNTRATIVAGGVDLTREERLTRCNKCYTVFTNARNRVEMLKNQYRTQRKVLDVLDIFDRLYQQYFASRG